MIWSMTKLGRAARAGALIATLAIVGGTAVMASATAARAGDRQASDAAEDNAINQRAAALGATVDARSGPYASARRHRGGVASPAARKGFQDIK
jgi:hypothetical protein